MGELDVRDTRASVAIAILTFRRPDALAPLVEAVRAQTSGLRHPARVVVVDNDPGASARAVVARLGGPDLTYVHEPRPGIAAARNAALDAAAADRVLVFIDDDELPEPRWLARLLEAWRDWPCDAVSAPTVKVLPDDAEGWVVASRFFARAHRATGVRVEGAAAGNLLLDLDAVRSRGVRFDERFGLTGGEDSLFSRQLTARGGVIRWRDDAVTSEPVVPERATRSWVLRRERRTGSTWSRVHLVLAAGAGARVRVGARLAMTAAVLVVRGVARVLLGALTRDLGRRAHGQRELARAAGVLTGLVGGHVEEYARAEPVALAVRA
ncbi:glycosyl transferase family 2 [Beutenbergia cavernae DSM 12333]|uniref:Glycosyl transferase family 2 n=1 Tax=Beutenbergia cavernae (strain ATCC BAA-8 / DSM 12333 / CCUG 43141 / JCM 11478 / NBRC 16432 / NCIMB 13614 / HKI 0122) TaxID=471853 RepID=C5C080_BEUC1|nr:glycosyltransferase [Beutenbergia cavernae]ACQ79266.1 glycosyl transferase family 2 [Beutenbergia cavernae DSM 12333]